MDTKKSAPLIDITSLANKLEAPLIDALNIYGQGKVQELLELTSVFSDNFEYTLYRFSATSQTELVYSTNKPAIAAIKLNEHLVDQGVLHKVLTLNDQPIGELILKQKKSPPTLTKQTSLLSAYLWLV